MSNQALPANSISGQANSKQTLPTPAKPLPAKPLPAEPLPKEPSDAARRSSPSLLVRAIVFGIAWLPLASLIVVTVPTFAETFAALGARGELPALTEWLMRTSVVNRQLLFLPMMLAIVLLIVADVAAARTFRRYWGWLMGMALMGLLATGVALFALLLPLLRLSAAL